MMLRVVSKTVAKALKMTTAISEVADDVGISFLGLMQSNFSDVLNMKRVITEFISKLQNFDQKSRLVDIALELSITFNNDSERFKTIKTGDET